jgi:hypothetical protein
LSLSVSFSREASAELAEAASWYDEQRAGLGAELIAAVDATVQRLAKGSRPVP